MVRCRYSPATATMPKTSVSSAASPACARALLWVAGSCRFAPDWTRPEMPATTISGPTASSSHGLRMVVSLRSSLCTGSTGVSFAGRNGQPEERRLQCVARRAEVGQRSREPELSGADDHYVVGHLGDLTQHMAGHDDRVPPVGQQ